MANNKKYFFEIKKTTQKDKYFGASTITEWEGALDKNNNYLFIVAKSLDNNMWEFIEYKPEELMKYSTIPPFHIYFNLPLSEKEKNKQRTNKTAVIANNKNINLLIKFFKKLKKNVQLSNFDKVAKHKKGTRKHSHSKGFRDGVLCNY